MRPGFAVEHLVIRAARPGARRRDLHRRQHFVVAEHVLARRRSAVGSTKNSAAGIMRSPPGPTMRNVAPSATSAGAVSDGWTM